MPKEKQKLTPEDVQATVGTLYEILIQEKDASIGIRRDKLVVWEEYSKKKYETTVTVR